MKQKNPYSDLVSIMQNQGAKYNPPSVTLGKVINPLPDLIILIGDLQVDKENLLLADDLQEHHRLINMPLTTAAGSTDQTSVADHGTHSHNMNQIGFDDWDIKVESCLVKNDLVAVLPLAGYQKYIVLCKVVS